MASLPDIGRRRDHRLRVATLRLYPGQRMVAHAGGRLECEPITEEQRNAAPMWQKRGTRLYSDTYEKSGSNPKTGQEVSAVRPT
jgi:hypothetical protein